MRILKVLVIVLIITLGASTASWYALSLFNSTRVPQSQSTVGVPRVAVLTSSYKATSGYEQRLISFLSYTGAIVTYIDFHDVATGSLTTNNFDVLTAADGISLWDLGYIPKNVTDGISGFSESGGGLLWFGHAGLLDSAGRFEGLAPGIENIVGISVKASSTRTPVVELTEKGRDLVSTPSPSLPWLMPTTLDITVRKPQNVDVLIRTLANETVMTLSHGPMSSAYSLYPISENMPSQFLSDELWKNTLFSLAKLDPRHPVGIPAFFDYSTMKASAAAFAVRRDDYLVPNDENILRLGFPLTILQWTQWFDGDPTIAPAYSRLLDLYDLELAHHTWSHSSPAAMASRIQYEMQQPIADLRSLFGVEPLVFGSPGGWSGFNASVVDRYSPPLIMHVGWQAGLYPTPIGNYSGLLGGIAPAIRDMNTPWSNATLTDWYNGFSAGLRVHRMISTEWHPGTSTNNLTQIETFLNWVRATQGDVLVTSLGRMALLDHMRYSITSIKGTYSDNTYTLEVSTKLPVYDLPLSIQSSVQSASLSDGRSVPFSDRNLVLPLLGKGTFQLKITSGVAQSPEIQDMTMKHPFLPMITDFSLDTSSVTIHLRADNTWIITRPEWFNLTIGSTNVNITGVQPESSPSCIVVSNINAEVIHCLLTGEVVLRIDFSPKQSAHNGLALSALILDCPTRLLSESRKFRSEFQENFGQLAPISQLRSIRASRLSLRYEI